MTEYDHDQYCPQTPLAVPQVRLEEANEEVNHRIRNIKRMAETAAEDLKIEQRYLERDIDLRDQLDKAVRKLRGEW